MGSTSITNWLNSCSPRMPFQKWQRNPLKEPVFFFGNTPFKGGWLFSNLKEGAQLDLQGVDLYLYGAGRPPGVKLCSPLWLCCSVRRNYQHSVDHSILEPTHILNQYLIQFGVSAILVFLRRAFDEKCWFCD